MTLFVGTQTRLLSHMSPINITMETYIQVLQNILKINNYYKTYKRVLQWLLKINNYYETCMWYHIFKMALWKL
jgi:hypothetical protein